MAFIRVLVITYLHTSEMVALEYDFKQDGVAIVDDDARAARDLRLFAEQLVTVTILLECISRHEARS